MWSVKTWPRKAFLGGSLVLLFAAAGPTSAHPPLNEQIQQLNARIHEEPGNADLFLRRADAYREELEWSHALKDLDRAAFAGSDPMRVDAARSRVLVEAQRGAEALQVVTRVLEQQPDHLPAQRLRSQAWALLGQPSKAADDLIRVLERMRPQPDLYQDLAGYLRDAGRTAEALVYLDRGMERMGQLSLLAVLAIEFELELGRPEAALARANTYLVHSRVPGRFLVLKGEILERLDRGHEAARVFDQALAWIDSRNLRAQQSQALTELGRRAHAGLGRLTAATAVDGEEVR